MTDITDILAWLDAQCDPNLIIPCHRAREAASALRLLMEQREALVKELRALSKSLRHPDRSCSLEAQGLDQLECAVVVERESIASKIDALAAADTDGLGKMMKGEANA